MKNVLLSSPSVSLSLYILVILTHKLWWDEEKQVCVSVNKEPTTGLFQKNCANAKLTVNEQVSHCIISRVIANGWKARLSRQKTLSLVSPDEESSIETTLALPRPPRFGELMALPESSPLESDASIDNAFATFAEQPSANHSIWAFSRCLS